MSGRLTPNQHKALAWYCEENQLKPQLSSYPTMFFLDKNGEQVKRDIQFILNDWEQLRKKKAGA